MALVVQDQKIKRLFIMKIYLATWLLEPWQGEALTKSGNINRLVSYYHTKEKTEQFEQYCETGTNENIPCRKRSDAKRSKKRVV